MTMKNVKENALIGQVKGTSRDDLKNLKSPQQELDSNGLEKRKGRYQMFKGSCEKGAPLKETTQPIRPVTECLFKFTELEGKKTAATISNSKVVRQRGMG